nr:metal ABC transporter ATP-binding protein [bacterium]
MTTPVESFENAVDAVGLELRYGANVVLEPSSFTAPMGAITALIGPNGAGKSTLLHSMVGLVDPTGGQIRVMGASPQKARRRVAYVVQSKEINQSLPLTVAQVVAMGRYANRGMVKPLKTDDKARVQEAMERMSITDLSSRHLTELSGGQRQRVFMAQGIAQDHRIMLLDEPLTGLDVVSAEAVDRTIHEEKAHGCAVLVSTHDLGEARTADHVLLLGKKRVISGPPSEVLTRENLLAAFGTGLMHI